MKIGSLFSGVGGLDLAVESFFDAETAWFVEYDKAPSKVLEHHWPGVPNYGDVTAVDWANLEPVDILTGGFPCQDLSLAGRRKGMRPGTRSGLWADYRLAISTLHPKIVVIENVRGLLSGCAESDMGSCPRCLAGTGKHQPTVRALGRVLGDLAEIGYDTEWYGLRAADAGAPHGRFRVFVIAHPSSNDSERGRSLRDMGSAADSNEGAGQERQRVRNAALNRRPTSAHSGSLRGREGYATAERGTEGLDRSSVVVERGPHNLRTQWGEYEPAIRRWESILGRPAPIPRVEDRLSGPFTEWMMGLPEGWVTDPAIGLTWNQQLKALGNGVVPQQALLALDVLMNPHVRTEAA